MSEESKALDRAAVKWTRPVATETAYDTFPRNAGLLAELADAVDSKSTDAVKKHPQNQEDSERRDAACALLAQDPADDDLQTILSLWRTLTSERRRLVAEMTRSLSARGSP